MNTTKYFFILATMTVAVVSVGLAHEPTESPELDSKLYELHFQEGKAHNNNRDRVLARKHFLMTIYLHPDHAGANYQLGLMAYSDNNYSAAISFLERASVEMSDKVELYYWLGGAYWKKSQAEGAIENYRKAVALDSQHENPFSLYALENLAEVYTRTEHLQESMEAYQAALKRETRSGWISKIKDQIAELHLTMGTYEDDGNTRYNEKGEAIGGIGAGDMRTNRYFEIARHTTDPVKEAINYQKSIEADPGMYQSYFNLGWALTRQRKYAEAVPAFIRSNEVWRQDRNWNPAATPKIDAHAFLALCYVELGEPEKALDYAEIALGSAPNYYYGLLYKARALTKLNRPQEAIPILEELVGANPDQAEPLYALYEGYRAALEPKLALAALHQAVRAQVDSQQKTRWQKKIDVMKEK
jgi:tetratricopeptide (TPR) repeat protein